MLLIQTCLIPTFLFKEKKSFPGLSCELQMSDKSCSTAFSFLKSPTGYPIWKRRREAASTVLHSTLWVWAGCSAVLLSGMWQIWWELCLERELHAATSESYPEIWWMMTMSLPNVQPLCRQSCRPLPYRVVVYTTSRQHMWSPLCTQEALYKS